MKWVRGVVGGGRVKLVKKGWSLKLRLWVKECGLKSVIVFKRVTVLPRARVKARNQKQIQQRR
jgi:hypothetical protein